MSEEDREKAEEVAALPSVLFGDGDYYIDFKTFVVQGTPEKIEDEKDELKKLVLAMCLEMDEMRRELAGLQGFLAGRNTPRAQARNFRNTAQAQKELEKSAAFANWSMRGATTEETYNINHWKVEFPDKAKELAGHAVMISRTTKEVVDHDPNMGAMIARNPHPSTDLMIGMLPKQS